VDDDGLGVMAEAMGQEPWRLIGIRIDEIGASLAWRRRFPFFDVAVTMKVMGLESRTVDQLVKLLEKIVPGYTVRGEYRTMEDLLQFDQTRSPIYVSFVSLRENRQEVMKWLSSRGIYGAWTVYPKTYEKVSAMQRLEVVRDDILNIDRMMAKERKS
jgi:hypothetical protein